jgi:hypothetical protein
MKRQRTEDDNATAPSYTKSIEAGELVASFRKSKSQFGGVSGSVITREGTPLCCTTPWMKLEYDPEPWDDAKQARFGKEKDKKLDANRKTDKWSFQASTDKARFIEYVEEIKNAYALKIWEQRDTVFPNDVSKKALKSHEALMGNFESMIKFENGLNIFRPDVRAEVGAQDITIPIENHDNPEVQLSVQDIGKGTEVAFVIDFSSSYINKSIKVYATPLKIAVRNVVPRLTRDGAKFKGEFDD